MTSVGGLDYITTRADPEASSLPDERIGQQMDYILGSIGDSGKFGLTDYASSYKSDFEEIQEEEEEEEEEEDDGPSPKGLKASAFGGTNDETDFGPAPAPERPRSSAFSQSSGGQVTPVSGWGSGDDPTHGTTSRGALTGAWSTRDTEMEGEPPPSSYGSLRGGAAPSLGRRRMTALADPVLSSVAEGSEPDSRDKSPHGGAEDVVEPARRSSPLPAFFEEVSDEERPLRKKPPDRTGMSSSVGETVLSRSVPDTAPTSSPNTDEEIMPRRSERSGNGRRNGRRPVSCTVETTRITDSRSPPGSTAPPLRRPPILKVPGAVTKDTSVRFKVPEKSEGSAPAASSRDVTAEPRRRTMSGAITPDTGTDRVKTGDSSVPAAPRTPGRRSMSHGSNVEPTSTFFSKFGPDYPSLNRVVSGSSAVPDTAKSGVDGSNEETKPVSTGASDVSHLTPAPQERRRAKRPAVSSTDGEGAGASVPVSTNGQDVERERKVSRQPDRSSGLPDTSMNGEESATGDRSRVPESSAPLTDSRVTGVSEDPPIPRRQRDPPPVPDNRPDRTTQQSTVRQTSDAQRSAGGTDTDDNRFLKVPSTPGFQGGLGGRQSSRQPRGPGNTDAGHTGPPGTDTPSVTGASEWDSSRPFQTPGHGPRQDRTSTARTPGRSSGITDARRSPAEGLQPPVARPVSQASSYEGGKEYLPHDVIPDTDFQITTDVESTGRDLEKLTDRRGALSPSSLLPSERGESKPSRGRRARRKLESWFPRLSRTWSERRRRKRKPIEDPDSDEKDDNWTDVRETGGSRQRDVTGQSDSASDMDGEEGEKGPVERSGRRRGFEYPRDTDTGDGTRGVEIDPRARRDRYETDESQRAAESTRGPPSGSWRPPPQEPARRASPPRVQIPDETTRADQTTQDNTRYDTDRSAFPQTDPHLTDQEGFDAEPRSFGYSNPGEQPYKESEVDPATSYVPSPPRDNTFVGGRTDDGQYSQGPPPQPPDLSGHGQPASNPPRHDNPQTTDIDDSRYSQFQRPGRHRYDQGDESRYDSGPPQRIPPYSNTNYRGPRYRVSRYSTTPRTLSTRALAAMPSIIDDAVQGLARRRASRDRYRSYGETSPPLASQWTRSFFRDVAGAVADAGIERLRRKPNPSMRRELASAVLPLMKSRISRRLDRSPPSTYSDSQYSGDSEYDEGYRSTRGAPRSRRSRRSRTGWGSGTRSRRTGRLRRSKTTRSTGNWLTNRMRSMASFAHDVRTREKAQEGWMRSRVGNVMDAHRSRYDPVLDLPGERKVGSHAAYMSREAAQSAANDRWVSRKQRKYFAQPPHSPAPPQPDDPMPREADSFADGGNLDQNLPPGGWYGRSGPPGGPRMGSRGMMG